MSEAALKGLREAMTPRWLREIDLNKIERANQPDLAIALTELLALLDFARNNVSQDDWAYMQRQVADIMKDIQA